MLLYFCLVVVYMVDWSAATTHKILEEIRDTPALPAPSLRSQLREAARDYRGRVVLSTDAELCPNTLVNVDPRNELQQIKTIVKAIFRGSPPNDSISIITAVGRVTGSGFIQGIPIVLYDEDVPRRWFGVISVVVIHPSTGTEIRHYRHPTHIPAKRLKAFVDSLQPGRILLIAGTAYYLHEDLKSYLSSLGLFLPTGYTLAAIPNSNSSFWLMSWVGFVGGNTIGEASRLFRPPMKEGLYQELYVPKSEDQGWCGDAVVADWSTGPTWEARQKLCQMYDGYGNFCSCPPIPPPNISELNGNRGIVMSTTVVVIMASRPTALHRLLVSLMQTGSIKKKDILVFTNQASAPELTLVCKSHGVSLEWSGRASDCNALHKTRLYESALTASVILRPKAQFFVTLEDDMEAEPDLFRWLSSARKILRYNDQFICINTIAVTRKQTTESNSKNSTHKNNDNNNMEGEQFIPGWAANRPVVEAILRFWPLGSRDMSWESLLQFWAGDFPCLAPPKSYVIHAAASFSSLGGDLSPAMPEEAKSIQSMPGRVILRGK